MSSFLKKIFKPFKNYQERIYENNLFLALDKLKNTCDNFSITLIDIGAAGDIEPRWKSVSRHLNYIGFEPDERSRKELINNSYCKSWVIYPNVLWDKKTNKKINFTKRPKASSFYVPNFNFVNLFPDAERLTVQNTISLNTITLDSLQIPNIDFIKLDIQGAELNVLKGANESLNNCIGLKVEVEFLQTYKDIPLYGEIVDYLKTKDFEFIDFIHLCRWERKEHSNLGQCIFGDGLFLKTPEFIIHEYKNDNKTLSTYLGICLIYNRLDLIDRVIELSGEKFKMTLKPFLESIKYFRKKQKRLKVFNKLINSILGFFFYKNTKSHIIY